MQGRLPVKTISGYVSSTVMGRGAYESWVEAGNGDVVGAQLMGYGHLLEADRPHADRVLPHSLTRVQPHPTSAILSPILFSETEVRRRVD